ncbi:MAG TPA: hypothetical protein VJO13_16520, partial [Ktedonobacterales bacterium]|nr:hypothetical protein [Ktedonobacterales bacterium]
MLLDGLDAVAWRRLTCTYGTGEDVPGWLRQLVSPSPKVRRAALWQLSNAFVHQDTVWTAAVAAIPFLAELLRAPEVGSKDGILMLLADIVDGYYSSYVAVGAREGETGEDTGTVGDKGAADGAGGLDDEHGDGEEDDERDERGPAREPQGTAIREGIPIYVALLDHADPAVRVAAVNLLASCDSPAYDARPALNAAYEREEHPAVKTCLLLARGGQYREPEARRAFFNEALSNPRLSMVERVTVAEMLFNESQDTVSDTAIDLVVSALAYPSKRLEEAYRLATNGHRDL